MNAEELVIHQINPKDGKPLSWESVNSACLNGELHCLRLRLKRRILWLRKQWANDPLQTFKAQVVSDAQADQLLIGWDYTDEARFYQEDDEASKLTNKIAGADHLLKEERQHWLEQGYTPALDLLGRLFGLSVNERRVLLLCLAPEFDPAFERLYAYIHDDIRRGYASAYLAQTLFALPAFLNNENVDDLQWSSLRLTPDAPLRYFRLLHLETGLMATMPINQLPLRLDERTVDYLLGIIRLDEKVVGLLRPIREGLLTTEQQTIAERLAQTLHTQYTNRRWPIINLIGSFDVGKHALVYRFAQQLGLQAYQIDLNKIPTTEPERTDLLHLLARESSLSQLLLYVDMAEGETQDTAIRAFRYQFIEDLQAFLMVGSSERWQCEREVLGVRLEKPDRRTQSLLWQQALDNEDKSLQESISALVEQFDFGPETIARTVRTITENSCPIQDSKMNVLTKKAVWQVAREQASSNMENLAQRINPCYNWDDMVLPEDTLSQLNELAAQVAQRPKVYEEWGFGAKLGRGRGISVLFAGPSGTGKTMAAEVLANHLQLDLFRIDLAGVVSKYIGETEKNLKKVFDAAEQSGAILFFDEADALFGKRTEVKDSHDRYANIEVNYLLQRMEDYRGLAILATNRKSSLDSAFLRRLRFLVDFPFPRAESRKLIWQRVFPPTVPLNGVDFDHLTRMDITGGNIRNIALNAAFLAAEENDHIGMNHVIQAAKREYIKIEKPLSQNEFGAYYDWVKK